MFLPVNEQNCSAVIVLHNICTKLQLNKYVGKCIDDACLHNTAYWLLQKIACGCAVQLRLLLHTFASHVYALFSMHSA